jgi:hypothetical protein
MFFFLIRLLLFSDYDLPAAAAESNSSPQASPQASPQVSPSFGSSHERLLGEAVYGSAEGEEDGESDDREDTAFTKDGDDYDTRDAECRKRFPVQVRSGCD